MSPGLSRREFVRAGGSLALLAAVPVERARALTARLVPGPPEDPDPGAVEARAAEAIDLLLGAFRVRPPLIHAGGPFSGRAGGGRDDFKRFVELDRQAALGWRIRLEGSRGRREREFAGPVRGLQQVYRDGLAHLDARARGALGGDFASAPAAAQDAILSDLDDDRVQELVGVAFANTLEAVYGPPEYGGNHGLVGWRYTDWPGDTQPRGFTPAVVSGAAGARGRLGPGTLRAFERFVGPRGG